jgi:hypothetical protein
VENPFRRIFNPDGTVNQEYVLSRLSHLEGLVRENRDLFPLRYDREVLENLLAEQQDLFADADDSESFEKAFRAFAELSLPALVTKEFDEKAKETLRVALHDSEMSRRDRAACACGLVLTLPAEGPPPQPHHENPFFDLILRITFNESMARVEFLQALEQEDIAEQEKEARLQEFFRSTPALLFEIQEALRAEIQKAVSSYERGEYSFGIGMDMILHGVRAIRSLTQEFEAGGGEDQSEEQKRQFAERFGEAIRDAFPEDVGEDEEVEIFARMAEFLESARANSEKKAARGLSSALEVMERNAEVRHRLLLAAYHEAVTGSRIYRVAGEEDAARALFEDPFRLDHYLEYGESLRSGGQRVRAERVYRVAMEFFPEEDEVRARLESLALSLQDERNAPVQARIAETERTERELEEEELA